MYQRQISLRRTIAGLLSGNLKHWSLRYAAARIRLEIDYKRHPTDPWLTREANKLIEQILRPNDVGFEWGSGRSTVWFAKRTKHLTSIEDSTEWYTRVQGLLAQQGISNVDYQLQKTQSNDDSESGEYSSYVQAISHFADETFDYVLVDGQFREWCAKLALRKLRIGGILILDNINWFIPPSNPRAPSSTNVPLNNVWAQFWVELQDWRRYWTSNGVTDTLIAIKQ